MNERFSIGNATLHKVLERYLKDIPLEARPTEDQLIQRLEKKKAAGIGYDNLWTLNIPLALRMISVQNEEDGSKESAIFCQAVALEEICHAVGGCRHSQEENSPFIDTLRYIIIITESWNHGLNK